LIWVKGGVRVLVHSCAGAKDGLGTAADGHVSRWFPLFPSLTETILQASKSGKATYSSRTTALFDLRQTPG
jgi:hypothetical protein